MNDHTVHEAASVVSGQGAPRTPVAVIGTLAEFHREPIPYDLAALVRLVRDLRPDLLCLDMTRHEWDHREFSTLPPEYAEALLPLAHQTDIVVVPIAGEAQVEEPKAGGWRGSLIASLRGMLAAHERAAPPAVVIEGLRHHVANLLYEVMELLAGPETYRAWHRHADHLGRKVLDVARRDPGRRVLVAVNIRHCHHIRSALRKYAEIRVVSYSKL